VTAASSYTAPRNSLLRTTDPRCANTMFKASKVSFDHDLMQLTDYNLSGHCTRGAGCWFRHELVKVSLDNELKQFDENMCNICLEKPETYGLLSELLSWLFECRPDIVPSWLQPCILSSGRSMFYRSFWKIQLIPLSSVFASGESHKESHRTW